ncbi:MAG: hypothetical protein Q8Q30_00900 [Candidatus Woesebacteria bacterium]|nr:hypothetical protein [Candidatus Woesebacteria bacterium]
MQIIILHGNDTVKSYERLTKFINEAKKRGWDIVNDKIEDTPSLFGTEKLIIVRDYKQSLAGSAGKIIKKIPGTLVIYSQNKIPAATLKSLNPDKNSTNFVVEKFELPVLLWKFLDNMTVSGLHELIKTQPEEYILAMMAWKLKQSYRTNPTPGVGLMISELAEIDVKSKTSKADLLLSLDLLLSKKISL